MLIGEFNRYFSRHGKWIFFGIGALVCLGMLLFIGPDSQSAFSATGNQNTVGYVGERPFTQHEMRLHVTRLHFVQTAMYLSFMSVSPDDQWSAMGRVVRGGSSASGWKDVAPNVFSELRMIAAAEASGAGHVTDAEVAEYVKALPLLQANGAFSRERYDKLMDVFVEGGLSHADFEEIIRQQIVLKRMENRLEQGMTVSDNFARRRVAYSGIESTVALARFEFFSYMAQQEITDADIQKAYDEGKSTRYLTPQRRTVTVARVPKGDISGAGKTLSEESLRTYYETNKPTMFTVTEVHAREIFRSLPAEASDEQKDAVLADLESYAEQVRNGADFAELATKHSEDAITSGAGGDLGWFTASTNPRARIVFSLADGEISKPQPSSDGFRIYQRVESRQTVQPFEQVRDRIETIRRRILQGVEDGNEAHRLYQQGDYRYQPQVSAAHILLLTEPQMTAEERAAVRQKLEDIRAQAIANDNFGELAAKHSEDRGSASRQGELGWFGRGRMVAPFENAAFSMKVGEVSDIIETEYGFHIIKKIDERASTPFEGVGGVREQLIAEVSRKRGDYGRLVAQGMVSDLHYRLAGHPDRDPQEELQKLIDASKFKSVISVLTTKPFHAGSDSVMAVDSVGADVRIGGSDVAAAVFAQMSEARRMTSLQQSDDFYLVVVADTVLPPEEPKLTDELKRTISRDLQQDTAKKAAREAARAYAAELREALDEGQDFEQAKGSQVFTTETFRLNVTPGAIPDGGVIQGAAIQTPAGQLAGAFDSANGAIVIFVVSHTLPSEEQLDSSMTGEPDMTSYTLRRSAMLMLDQELTDAYPVSLNPAWTFLDPTIAENSEVAAN